MESIDYAAALLTHLTVGAIMAAVCVQHRMAVQEHGLRGWAIAYGLVALLWPLALLCALFLAKDSRVKVQRQNSSEGYN
jgi:hypothetical protein